MSIFRSISYICDDTSSIYFTPTSEHSFKILKSPLVKPDVYNVGPVAENRIFHQQPPAPCMPTTRAVPLPPPILHNRPSPAIPQSVKYNYYSPAPPPPDVTVFSSKNFLTTFAHKADETEGHLV